MTNTNDLRVIKTRAAIENAFISLLKKKDFERITVQNILDEALVNRKTFYSHYEDKYRLADLLIERVIENFQPALAKRFTKSDGISSRPENMRAFYHTIFTDRERMLALFKVRTDNHYLWDDLMEILKSTYLENMTLGDSQPSDLEKDYLCLSYATISLSSIKWALELGSDEAIETIIDTYSRSFSASGFIWPVWPQI